MPLQDHTILQTFFDKFHDNHALQSLQGKLNNSRNSVDIYKESIPVIENEIWRNIPDAPLIELYQKLFQELESNISLQAKDGRYKFVIVIPVADRPQHLENCLNSLLALCRAYHYGGFTNNKYNKVSVIIADDSKHDQNIAQNKEIARQSTLQGIETDYFGLEQQITQIDAMDKASIKNLSTVLGDMDHAAFYHKGPSIMRNITYLKLNKISTDNEKILFYFMDSDQEFRIKVNTAQGDEDIYAVNYFYHLDRIFSETNTCILTGKVVGDPPVSPAVMVGNFLADVIDYLRKISELSSDNPCQFHAWHQSEADDAAYHDMANLFGFKSAKKTYPYQCPLCGEHSNARCFINFAKNLNRFFFGEHPTRKTYYQYRNGHESLTSARTIYTGNYIFRPEALRYFIPFATLKLRMAGPVLGRIIKAEINDRFMSANLPMLHKRTLDESGQSEFRPGINGNEHRIDLSVEFERQYFGDVMLFTIEKLTEAGYPYRKLSDKLIRETVGSTEQMVHQQYSAKHTEIIKKLTCLNGIIDNPGNWWNRQAEFESAKRELTNFSTNIEHNYGDDSIFYQLINSATHKKKRLNDVADSIVNYTTDRQLWENLLG